MSEVIKTNATWFQPNVAILDVNKPILSFFYPSLRGDQFNWVIVEVATDLLGS